MAKEENDSDIFIDSDGNPFRPILIILYCIVDYKEFPLLTIDPGGDPIWQNKHWICVPKIHPGHDRKMIQAFLFHNNFPNCVIVLGKFTEWYLTSRSSQEKTRKPIQAFPERRIPAEH